jgi:hypothetical protein
MNIWLEGLYLEEIREKEKSKSEDSSLVEKQEELQDIDIDKIVEENKDITTG